jgi:hypothetical protein
MEPQGSTELSCRFSAQLAESYSRQPDHAIALKDIGEFQVGQRGCRNLANKPLTM